MADKLAATVTSTFADAATGVYLDNLQTHSAMPLASGLVPSSLENKTMASLAHQITVTDKGHLDTGLTGTYFMTKMLMEAGRVFLDYRYTAERRVYLFERLLGMALQDPKLAQRRPGLQ